jgi:hypothetical protein
MANRNTVGFGLIAQGTVGSTDANQGQGKYYIQSNMAAALYQGTSVQSKAGYIMIAEDGRTKNTIGILNGIFYNAATTQKPTFANHYVANTVPANSENITAFVIDNPLQLFSVSADLAVTQAMMGTTRGVTQAAAAGSTLSGQSSKQLDIGNGASATANTFRLLRSAEDPENNDLAAVNSTIIVTQNLNQYLTNAVTWQ